MAHDKKFLVGRNRFVLLTGIGQWTEREAVPSDVVRDAPAKPCSERIACCFSNARPDTDKDKAFRTR